MKILDKIKKDKEPLFFKWGFFNEVEANLIKISNSTTIATEVDPIDYVTYAGDFYGWLRYKFPSIETEHYWVILRVNNMLSPQDFDERYKTIYTLGGSSELSKLVANFKEAGYTAI